VVPEMKGCVTKYRIGPPRKVGTQI